MSDKPIIPPLPERLPDYVVDRHEDIKNALKEAIREWLDEKLAEVGKWTLRGIAAGALATLVYFMVHFGIKP